MRNHAFAIAALLTAFAIDGARVRVAGQAQGDDYTRQTLALYAAGSFDQALPRLRGVAILSDFQDQLDKLSSAWLASRAVPPDVARHALAGAALEAAATHLDLNPSGAVRLTEWACAKVRAHRPADDFDRRWQLAALAVLEGAMNPKALAAHLDHAAGTLPEDPRLALARGLVIEQRLRDARGPAAAHDAADAVAASTKARAVAGAAAEADMRIGRLDVELQHPDEALAALDAVEPQTHDPWLLFLARLFRGRALDALGRSDDAEAAVRGALALAPGAHSATIALVDVLFERGARDEAATLADQLMREPPAADPWTLYWPGDFRLLLSRLADMREAVK